MSSPHEIFKAVQPQGVQLQTGQDEPVPDQLCYQFVFWKLKINVSHQSANEQPPLSPGLFLYVSSGRGVLMAASFTACLSFFCSLRCFLATFCCFIWRFFSLFSSFTPLVFNRRRNVGRRFFDRGWREQGKEGRQETGVRIVQHQHISTDKTHRNLSLHYQTNTEW